MRIQIYPRANNNKSFRHFPIAFFRTLTKDTGREFSIDRPPPTLQLCAYTSKGGGNPPSRERELRHDRLRSTDVSCLASMQDVFEYYPSE
jgi:hypothetical protein